MKDRTWYANQWNCQRYVSAAVNTVAAMAPDENALAGFRWSLTLVAKCLGVPRDGKQRMKQHGVVKLV